MIDRETEGAMTRFACLLLMLLPCMSVDADRGDPFVGRWRLDVTSSSFSSGPTPMAEFLTISAKGSALVINRTTVDSRGRLHGLTSAALEHASPGDVSVADDKRGTHSARVRVFPWIDKMTLERLSPTSARATFRKGGDVRFSVDAVVDDTAGLMTWDQAGTDVDARPFTDHLVFRK
jgi:hypothetical protein